MRNMIETIDATIDGARARSLDFVVQLLEMARLELIANQHGIEVEELKSFCEHISRPHAPVSRRATSHRAANSPRIPTKARRRRAVAPPQG